MLKFFFILFLFSGPLRATSQTVDFSFQNSGSFCSPAIVNFTQNITGNPTGFFWNLGNGLKTSETNPSTTYANAGTYTVKLIAVYPTGTKEISKTVVINAAVTPKITADRNYICQPGVINFSTAANGSITGYDWDFGDTTPVVSTTANTTTHSFGNYSSYTAIVKVTAATGCFGQDTMKIEVKKIPLTATATPTSGCIPANVNFVAVDSIPLNSNVTSYSWDYGEGSPLISGNNTVTHVYNNVGVYLPKLTITTDEGCANSFNLPAMGYGAPPTNSIAYAKKTPLCGSEISLLVGKATKANRYTWNFGDGTSASIPDTIIQHKFTTLGTKTVTVTPLNNGCAGTPATFPITIIGIIAKYNFSSKCIDKNTFSFANTSLGNNQDIIWDFGDGTPTASTPNTKHTYAALGQYVTKLTVVDTVSKCLDTFSRTMYIANPTLINADSSVCKNTSTIFTIDNNYDNPAATYFWNIAGRPVNTKSTPTATVNANILGNFDTNYVVIINGPSVCRDTVRLDHSLLVRGPDLNFTMPASICFGDLLIINNTSAPFIPKDSVTLWYWNYGNTTKNDTVYQPNPVQYSSSRPFLVKLIAVDINGCKDSLNKIVRVNRLPFLQVIPAGDTLCSGRSDSLFAIHSDSISWSPSAGLSCANCDTVLATPAATTQYFVNATTSFGCSITDSVLVKVIPDFAAGPASANSQYLCANDQTMLDVNPKDKIVVWSPTGSLSNANIYNPVVKPTQTTTYTATLSDSTGCFTHSADITVFIKSLPTVEAGPNRILQYNAPFNITPQYSANVQSYSWSPSALLNCSNCANPTGFAAYSETYHIRVTSDSGCIADDSINIFIECKDANILMPKAFTPNNDNINDYYYPITRGVKMILKFIIYNREGRIMFQAKDISPNNKTSGWDGTFKGSGQPGGGYVYILESLCELGEKIIKSGSFLLLR